MRPICFYLSCYGCAGLLHHLFGASSNNTRPQGIRRVPLSRKRLLHDTHSIFKGGLVCALMLGCSGQNSPRILLEGYPPRTYEYVEDGIQIKEVRGWYSAKDLDVIVKEYVRKNNIDFDFRGTSAGFWAAREREFLAHASYSSGIGGPVLSLDIGWDGHVRSHRMGVAVCGTCQSLLEGADGQIDE
jgi:hypothetical protein